jgi:CBS domain-containing protein/sporulation protein YlmC with PRC-barrel domain
MTTAVVLLHATEVLGGEAYDMHGNFVGKVRELFIEPADQANRVARYLLDRDKYLPLLARYNQVSFVAPGVIKLNVEEKELEHFRPNEAWLAVRKDLLDQQIIDTGGRKVVRVNDIDLTELRVNGTVELRIEDVDVGLTGATRRLLQGLASPGLIRRIQRRLPTRLIRWELVNLIEPDPLRRVKLRITHQKLEKMHPADLADIMEELSPVERQAIIASLDEESAAEALAELDSRLTSQIVEKLAPEKAADILEEMEPDKAADLLADLPAQTSQDVLDVLSKEEARQMTALLKFDSASAGGMMNTEFLSVGESATRAEAVAWVGSKEAEVNLDQLDSLMLVDNDGKFSGEVAISRLLLAPDAQQVSELKSIPLVSVPPDADEKEVFELFDKYNLRSLGVVDPNGRAMGVIAVDDVVTRLRAHL